MSDAHKNAVEKQWKASGRAKQMTECRHFVTYAYRLFTGGHFYSHWKNLLAYIRRFRMIAILFRILTILFGILQTGALVLLSTVLFLILLPAVLLLTLGLLIAALADSVRANRKMRLALNGKQVYILFLPREECRFLQANAKELAARGNAVILISPYWLSGMGFSKGSFYCTVRKEERDLYLIRRYYFFSLRKKVLQKNQCIFLY